MTDNDHTDAEYARRELAYEMGEETGEDKRWDAWVKQVCYILKLDSLDGDEKEDGYSLDGAREYFDEGESPDSYAEMCKEPINMIWWNQWAREVAEKLGVPEIEYDDPRFDELIHLSELGYPPEVAAMVMQGFKEPWK